MRSQRADCSHSRAVSQGIRRASPCKGVRPHSRVTLAVMKADLHEEMGLGLVEPAKPDDWFVPSTFKSLKRPVGLSFQHASLAVILQRFLHASFLQVEHPFNLTADLLGDESVPGEFRQFAALDRQDLQGQVAE